MDSTEYINFMIRCSSFIEGEDQMKRALIYSLIFVVVFVVWNFSSKVAMEVYFYLIESIEHNYENLTYMAYGLWFKHLQWVVVFIFIYGWIKKVYPSRSTFFRGIMFGLLIGLDKNLIFSIYLFLIFFGESMGLMLSGIVVVKWLACLITAQFFAFFYDRLMDRFLESNISGDMVGSDGQNQSQSMKRVMRKILIYSIIFVVGFFILGFADGTSISSGLEKQVKEVMQWDIKMQDLKSILGRIQQVIVFIGVYILLKKVYPSCSTFFRGIVIGLLIGMTTNAIFGIPLYLLSVNVPFEAMIFAYIVLSWLACFITGLVIAFSYDQLVDRFLKPSVSP